MFVLVTLEDNLNIAPHNLNKDNLSAVTEEIQSLYFDRVVRDSGLCVTLYDIKSIEGGFIYPSAGYAQFQVTFRLVMFRPFVGEILIGKLKHCDETGLFISLGFFDDIHIPEHHLQEPSFFDKEEKLWVWKFDGNDMFMDLDEEVRFRVADVKYPPIPIEHERNAKPFAPMQIVGDVNADGLGLLSWWS